MTLNNLEMQTLLEDLFSEIIEVRKKAHREYAQRHDRDEDNVFANFERHGRNLGLSREQVWAVYASKHWDGIISHIAGNVAQREPIEGRIIDLITYLTLFYAMVKEDILTHQTKND